MNNSNQQIAEWQRLRELSDVAGFWTVSEVQTVEGADEEPLFQFEIQIDGRSISDAGPEPSRVSHSSQQQIQISLQQDFPNTAPLVCVINEVFHPNIPADRIISMEDLGLQWTSDLTLDLVLERLWDVLRGSYFDVENAINLGAGQSYASQPSGTFPIDARPLAGLQPKTQNIVRYRKRGQQFRRVKKSQVHVIDDAATPAQQVDVPNSTGNSDAIFYID